MVFLPTLLALLASCDIAYGGTFGAGGTPGDYTEDEFAAFFGRDRRNASGIVHFDGYNVSKSFPPNSTITGWGAKIEVAPVDHKGDGQPNTGTRITFEAPDDVTLPGNDSDWNSCVAFYPPDWLKKNVRRKEGDGDNSCSFLSDDCQRALQAAADGYFWNDGECPFPPSVPEECDNQKSKEADQAFGFTATNFSATFNGSTAFSYLPGEDSNEDQDYDIAVGGYWTIMINWGRRDPLRYTTGETPQASLICLKANDIENGSEGGAMRPLVDTVLVLFTCFFTTAWLIR